MLSTALVAIDATVIATAVPSVVAELGGFAQFPWLFSVYLLAQAVTVPVYGKLADVFGRKPVMLVGIGLFLVGSILCGAAWSMGALIAFRAVQGLGAGAVQPMAMTIVGDLYSLEERAKVQGYIASVWAHLVGRRPDARRRLLRVRQLAVDLLRQHPALPDRRRHDRPAVPRAGRAAPAADRLRRRRRAHRRPDAADPRRCSRAARPGRGGRRRASPSSAAGAVLLVAFVLIERRAADPVVPLRLLRNRLLVATQPRRGLRRRRPARADLLRADLRAGRAGHRPAGRRVRARRAHARLAALGVAVRPASTCGSASGPPRCIGAAVVVARLGAAAPARRVLERAPGGRDVVRHRPRHGLRRGADADRGAVGRRSGSSGAWSPAPTCSSAPRAAPIGVAVFGAIVNATLGGVGRRGRPGRAGGAHRRGAPRLPRDDGAGGGDAGRRAAHAARPGAAPAPAPETTEVAAG